MDRSRTTDKRSIHRLVALLLTLADLAERAGGRSAAVRGLVLWLLRSGEALARDYVAGLAWGPAGQAEPLRFTRDSAAEAIRLATSFRKLAAALTTLADGSLAPLPQTHMTRFAAFAAVDRPAAFGGSTSVVERRDSS